LNRADYTVEQEFNTAALNRREGLRPSGHSPYTGFALSIAFCKTSQPESLQNAKFWAHSDAATTWISVFDTNLTLY
jgi:hypothetical protein